MAWPTDEVWVLAVDPQFRWHPLDDRGTHTQCGRDCGAGRYVSKAAAVAAGMLECGACYRARARRRS